MDALEQYLSSGTAESPISEALLDRLKQTESSGNPKAVNKTSGAMGAYQFMPGTVDMLGKQGIKFDPMDEKQSREAARQYLTQLYNQTGSLDKALAAYGGFKTADPTKYVQSVKGSSDPLEDYLSAPVTKAATTEAAPVSAESKSNVPKIMQDMLAERQKGQQQALGYAKQFGQGAASLADTTIGGIIPSVAGAVTYAGQRALQHTPEEAAAAQQRIEQQLGQPFGKLFGVTQTPGYQQESSRKIMDFVGQNIGKGAQWISQQTGLPVGDVQNMMGTLAAPAAEVIGPAGRAVGRGYQAIERMAVPEAARIVDTVTKPKTAFGAQSIGAAQLTPEAEIKAALAQASPETQAALRGVPANDINLEALNRHVEADSLPIPVRLTKGQASQDVSVLSNEMNTRGKNPELAQRYNEQNGQLIDNINAIRDQVAPDVHATHHIENAENIINAYKDLDTARNTDISNKFQALRDAAGGELPVDAKTLLDNIDKKMKSELLSTDAQKVSQYQELKKLAENGTMSFDNYLNMRRNMSKISAQDADASVRTAAKMMVQELDKLPLSNETAGLKPLADVARSAARERFQLLEKDPAYQAAVNDVAPDKFVNKYVINANKRDLDAMLQQLGADSEAGQHVKAATINYLKEKAGIVNDNGNFSQSGFNKALMQLDPKLQYLVGEATPQLKTLGNVARYTQAQPRGSFVNNSNTLVGAIAQNLAKSVGFAAEKGINAVVPGAQLGTAIMERRAVNAAKQATKESLKPGAGTRLSDIGKPKKETK